MTVREIFETLRETGRIYIHHTAMTAGYVSRRHPEGKLSVYNNRFGRGFTLDLPNWKSTRYSIREYWIFKE